jgi:DNA polymerase-4
VTLKLKTADFRVLTRSRAFETPTQLADRIFSVGRALLEREINGTRYRLIGIGVSELASAGLADPADLLDRNSERRAAAERAMDQVRGRFGPRSLLKGISLEESGT